MDSRNPNPTTNPTAAATASHGEHNGSPALTSPVRKSVATARAWWSAFGDWRSESDHASQEWVLA